MEGDEADDVNGLSAEEACRGARPHKGLGDICNKKKRTTHNAL